MDSTLPTFKVVFAHDRDAAQQGVAKAMTVAIFPHDDRWEDQGFVLGAAAVIRTHAGIVELPQLAFLSSSSQDSIETLTFDLGNRPFSEAKELMGDAWWAVMLEDVSSYRDLVARVGLPNAVGALRAMHDIPAEGLLSAPAPWRALAVASTGFRVAMLRSVSRYFAFRRAANVLNGNERQAIEMASAQATLRFKLDTFSSHHQIPFVFRKTKFFDHRVNVLVGENGVGKSQALARIVDALELGSASKSQFFTEGPLVAG